MVIPEDRETNSAVFLVQELLSVVEKRKCSLFLFPHIPLHVLMTGDAAI